MDAGSERDSREFVQELKFYLSPHAAAAAAAWGRQRLQPDPHGGGECADEYAVTSVYFDTAGFDVYRRVGSFGRAKYRVRRYDGSDFVFLERKAKTRLRVSKRRSRVALEALAQLNEGEPELGWAGYWFHRRLLGRALRPVCCIGYRRLARVGYTEGGPVRMTLDQDLRAWRVADMRFETANAPITLTRNRPILELKFGRTLPAVFKELIHQFAATPQGISKYRLALPALGLAAATTANKSTSDGITTGDGRAETVNA
jgi:hypothetical protein